MKISSLRLLGLAAATAFTAIGAWAVPAKPGLVTVVQDDGTELTIKRIGDEHSHMAFTQDGYLLTAEGNQFFYATVDAEGNPVSSGIKATQVEKRTEAATRFLAGSDREAVRRSATAAMTRNRTMSAKSPARIPSTMLTTKFPSTGKQKAIVVLVEYKDVKFRLDDPYDYFHRMLNEDGFSSYGGTGCAHEYFLECSGGQFDPEFDLYGPVTLSQKMEYYGGNDSWGNDLRPEEMVLEACNQLDATVDFSEYDRDGDGYIDNVFVIYAGQGEASYGSRSTVWPHASEVSGVNRFDGVILKHYGCTNEWEQNQPDGVGTFIHEFSHVMGLPDLYVTDYQAENFTPCEWSVLDVGPYNNDGRTPPLYSAFERMSMGWMKPEAITDAADITLLPVSSNTAYYIPTEKNNEFFLLENRQLESWDTYIPGHGMLVWHVDYNTSAWNNNIVNDKEGYPRVQIEAAGGASYKLYEGTKVFKGTSSDPFPGTKRKTSFTDTTSPAMTSWTGKGQNRPITEIAESGGLITFAVSGGHASPLAVPVAIEPAEISGTRFVARWEPVDGAESYMLALITDGEEIPRYIPVEGATTCDVTGLVPETAYRYKVAARALNRSTKFSDEIEVVTTAPSLGDIAIKATDATDIDGNSFTANWEAEPLATGYRLTVNKYTPPTAYDFTALFDNSLPQGWESDSNEFESKYTLSGIVLSGDNSYVSTGTVEAGIRTCTFKHYGVGAASLSNRLVVMALDGDNWVKIAETYPNIATTTYSVRGIPENCKGIKVTYSIKKDAPIIIGEFNITGGTNEDSSTPLDGYQDLQVGNVTSFSVTGLEPDTHYIYSVVATDDDNNLRSAPSNSVVALTSPLSGIVSAGAGMMLSVESVPGGIAVATAGADTEVTVWNLLGHAVYAGLPGSISLPAGLYIVTAPGATPVKVVVR